MILVKLLRLPVGVVSFAISAKPFQHICHRSREYRFSKTTKRVAITAKVWFLTFSEKTCRLPYFVFKFMLQIRYAVKTIYALIERFSNKIVMQPKKIRLAFKNFRYMYRI